MLTELILTNKMMAREAFKKLKKTFWKFPMGWWNFLLTTNALNNTFR